MTRDVIIKPYVIIKQFGVSKGQAVVREVRRNSNYQIETGRGAVLTLYPREFDDLLLALLECRREYELAYGIRR